MIDNFQDGGRHEFSKYSLNVLRYSKTFYLLIKNFHEDLLKIVVFIAGFHFSIWPLPPSCFPKKLVLCQILAYSHNLSAFAGQTL